MTAPRPHQADIPAAAPLVQSPLVTGKPAELTDRRVALGAGHMLYSRHQPTDPKERQMRQFMFIEKGVSPYPENMNAYVEPGDSGPCRRR